MTFEYSCYFFSIFKRHQQHPSASSESRVAYLLINTIRDILCHGERCIRQRRTVHNARTMNH
jgi:hypothetical protein